MKEIDEAVRRYIEKNDEQGYGACFKTLSQGWKKLRIPQEWKKLMETVGINAIPDSSPFNTSAEIKHFYSYPRCGGGELFGGSTRGESFEDWMVGKRVMLDLTEGGRKAEEGIKTAREALQREGMTAVLALVKQEARSKKIIQASQESGSRMSIAASVRGHRNIWVVIGHSSDLAMACQTPTASLIDILKSSGGERDEITVYPEACGEAWKGGILTEAQWTERRKERFIRELNKSGDGRNPTSRSWAKCWGIWSKKKMKAMKRWGFQPPKEKKHRTEKKKSQRAEDGKRAELATFLIYKKLWDRWRARKPRRKGLRLRDAAIHRKKEKHKKRKKGKTRKERRKRV